MPKGLTTIKLDDDLTSRIEELGSSLGLSRASIVGLCVRKALPHLEQFGDGFGTNRNTDAEPPFNLAKERTGTK
jgi:hypothetical protein